MIELPHLHDPLRVEAGGGLIQDDELGAREESLRDAKALFHAVGEGLHLVAPPLGESDGGEGTVDCLRADAAVKRADDLEVAPGAQVGIEIGAFDQAADAPERGRAAAVDALAKELDEAAGGAHQGEHHPDRRAFAGAVGAEEAEDFAAMHVQAQILDCPAAPVAFGKPFGPDDGGGSFRHGGFPGSKVLVLSGIRNRGGGKRSTGISRER